MGWRERSEEHQIVENVIDSVCRYLAVESLRLKGRSVWASTFQSLGHRRRGDVPVRKSLMVSCLLFALAIDSPQPVRREHSPRRSRSF